MTRNEHEITSHVSHDAGGWYVEWFAESLTDGLPSKVQRWYGGSRLVVEARAELAPHPTAWRDFHPDNCGYHFAVTE